MTVQETSFSQAPNDPKGWPQFEIRYYVRATKAGTFKIQVPRDGFELK